MEVDEIQTRGCKFPRTTNYNGRLDTTKIDQLPDEDGGTKRGTASGGVIGRGGRGVDLSGGLGRFYGWSSSRIVRVSRASGGKDRHSKVLTSKGLRDRRVRLSVSTAIQFYDLQDRLGYDQPSKAVEWLLNAAASSISELPPMDTPFPDSPKQPSNEKRSSTGGTDQLRFDSADQVEIDGGDANYHQHMTTLSKSSACSSTSETSKGSGLSLSRSESRVKARERAKERVAEKEKEKENEFSHVAHMNPISQTTSFTELLNAGINNLNNNQHNNTPTSCGSGTANESNFFQKSPRQWSSTPMDYFTSGLLGPPVTRPGHMLLGNPLCQPLTTVSSPLFSLTSDQPELQHFSFLQDNLVPVVTAARRNDSDDNQNDTEYNLNFTISSSASSGLSGFNRGTLQSNSSSSLLPPHQRFSPLDGSPSFFIGTAAVAAPAETHHQFLSGFDARLKLYPGGGHSGRHSGQEGKGKN